MNKPETERNAARYLALRNSLGNTKGCSHTQMPVIHKPANRHMTYTPEGLDRVIDDCIADMVQDSNLAAPIDPNDFYSIEDAIVAALNEGSGNPDDAILSPKTRRRLAQAITRARELESAAARAPAPISDGQIREWLLQLAACETAERAIVRLRALLAERK